MPQAVLLDAQEQAAKDVAAVPVPRHTDGVRHALRVFTTLVGLRYKARLMYPAAYYSFLAAKLVGYISEYAVIWLLLERFKTIAGWTLPEVLLLHSINVISYTIAGISSIIRGRARDGVPVSGTSLNW